MKRSVLSLIAATLSAAALGHVAARPSAAATDQEVDKAPLMASFSDLKWTDLPERKGMQFSVLSGDPKRAAYTQLRRVPAGTDNTLHRHSSELTNVIISGMWYTGADAATARDFGPGSVVMMPANWAHVSGCRAGRECVFYQDGKGKFDFQPVTVPAGRGSGEASSAMSRSPTHAVTRSHAAGTSGAGTKASTPTPKNEATFKGVVEDVNTSGHTMGQARRGMPLRRLLVRTDPRKNRARVSGGRPPVTGD